MFPKYGCRRHQWKMEALACQIFIFVQWEEVATRRPSFFQSSGWPDSPPTERVVIVKHMMSIWLFYCSRSGWSFPDLQSLKSNTLEINDSRSSCHRQGINNSQWGLADLEASPTRYCIFFQNHNHKEKKTIPQATWNTEKEDQLFTANLWAGVKSVLQTADVRSHRPAEPSGVCVWKIIMLKFGYLWSPTFLKHF